MKMKKRLPSGATGKGSLQRDEMASLSLDHDATGSKRESLSPCSLDFLSLVNHCNTSHLWASCELVYAEEGG